MEIRWLPDPIVAGTTVVLKVETEQETDEYRFVLTDPGGTEIYERELNLTDLDEFEIVAQFEIEGEYTLAWNRTHPRPRAAVAAPGGGRDYGTATFIAVAPEQAKVHKVELLPNTVPNSDQDALWRLISTVSDRLRFANFERAGSDSLFRNANTTWYGTGPYERLDAAAAAFLEVAANIDWAKKKVPPNPNEPYEIPEVDPDIKRGLQQSYVYKLRARNDLAKPVLDDFSTGIWNIPLPTVPLVELIWNYWIEEGMLVQTLNRILARFQNRLPDRHSDPLQRLSVNPLVPLRSLLWGFAESERERLSVRRRAAEYEYQYGLQLLGRAVPPRSATVEQRTPFLEAFHNLLHSACEFYKEHDDKTMHADAFPLLSSLRELHLVLAYGANNQFADLPLTARREMIVMQWILAQPEMREFLGGRTMVPYEESWMDRVDTMKSMQRWSDVSISHFFDLAVHGEKLLLSVRHGNWNGTAMSAPHAENWALIWRPSVQRYVHDYRAVTGADLTVRVDTTMPSTLLARRLQQRYART
ncbi:hypothetical protein [Rhodococcus aetherivorans]